MRYNKSFLILLCSILPQFSHQADLQDFQHMLDKMSQDTLDFARFMEEQLITENKCHQDNFIQCDSGSYDDCNSEYPSASCPGSDLNILACGSGEEGGCGGSYDFTVSTLRLAPSITFSGETPSENSVKDAICYSLQAESFMNDKFDQDREYWSKYDVHPPPMYYGSDEGVFRMFPGNPKQPCPSTYDPRLRPWYIAASSGPKSVVLVLDTSGSMGTLRRLETMKDAAIRVIDTLGVSDYVSVIEFNDYGDVLGGHTMLLRATTENKNKLIGEVQSLTALGRTNFESAFFTAFNVLDESASNEIGTSCHNAIIFLTDGEITQGANGDDVINLIEDRKQRFSDAQKPIVFTYSFGGGADETVPKNIACRNNGTWSRIQDGEDLSESMGAYYKYFAYGLGSEINEDFVAWIEMYEFANGNGLGTTASAPVYDRTVDPPVLAGVVGMDFSLLTMEKALGDETQSGRETVIDRIVDLSIARCPRLELSDCQLQSLRYYGGKREFGDIEALCPASLECAITRTYTATCNGVNYPTSFIKNKNHEGKPFVERSCCHVGEIREIGIDNGKGVCKETNNMATLIIILSSVGCGLICCGCGYWYYRKRRAANAKGGYSEPVQAHVHNESVVAVPVPSAPHDFSK